MIEIIPTMRGSEERVFVDGLEEGLRKTLVGEEFLIDDVPGVNVTHSKSIMAHLVHTILEYPEHSNLFLYRDILRGRGLTPYAPSSLAHVELASVEAWISLIKLEFSSFLFADSPINLLKMIDTPYPLEVDTPYPLEVDTSEVVRYHIIQGIGYGVLEFLGVGTMLDIFQNIHILYLEYGVLSFSGYGVLSFILLWSLTKSLKNPNSSIMKKLDRIMINGELIHQFQNASGEFFPFVISNHNPIVVTIPEGLKMNRRSFRFVNYIADKEEFADYVGQVWESEIIACHMYKVVQKLKRFKNPLNRLNWKNGNLSEKVTSLKEKLTNAQAEMEKDPFNTEMKAKATSFLNEYLIASNDELKLLQQKAKIKWLSESDQNTAYFHGILKSRKHKGRIKSIGDEKDVRFDGDNVATAFVEHFKSFLGSKHDVQPLDSVEIKFDKVLSKEEVEDMIGLVTDEEIKEAVFDIDSNKASGTDGYTSGFFKKAWHIVGKEVCLAIKDFFMNGKLLGEINATLIALIPKVDVSNKVSEGHGYFNGRERDSDKKARKIKYHHGCKELKLSNMCFADDLLVLCNGDVESVGVIKKTLDQFSSIYRLFPNMGKSVIFFGSVPLNVQNAILQVMPFQVGSLPMKYLGVPLIAKKLGINDCKSLVNKSTVYMLPTTTIKEIEKLLKVKQLWKIIEGNESLWVKWVNVVKLKGKSIWDIEDMKGPLSDFIPRRDRYKERYSDNENVADMINNGVWIWPVNWFNKYPKLCNIVIPILSNGVNDKIMLKKWSGIMLFGLVKFNPDMLLSSGWLSKKVAKQIWEKLKDKIGCIRCNNELKKIVSFLSKSKAKKNLGKVHRNVEQILKIITNNAKIRFMSLKVKQINTVIKAAKMWNLKWKDMWLIADRESLMDHCRPQWLVSNNLESSGCVCTFLVVFSVQFGLERKLDWIDEMREV
ncbi:hypothetical protein Tco_0270577 [Tanacetum coccineum]